MSFCSALLHYSTTPLLHHSSVILLIPLLHCYTTSLLQIFLILLRHAYLSLSVLMASSASAMAMIQNRTITFGSGQPLSSKW